MRTLARRVKSLEGKTGIDSPLIVINKLCLEQFTPEEQALFDNVRSVFVGSDAIEFPTRAGSTSGALSGCRRGASRFT